MSRNAASHWVWSPYSTERGLAFAVRITGLAPEVQRKVLCGERLGRTPRLSVTETTPGRFRDVLGAPVGILFVAPALREVLEQSAGSRLELAPTSVRGHPELRYFMVNVLDTVPAIDLDRSKYEVFPGTDAIRRIVRDDLKRRLTGASDHPGVLVRADKYRNEY